MPDSQAQSQAPAPPSTAFSIQRKDGNTPGTLIFSLSGPFTARSMYGSLTPAELQNMLDFQSLPNEQPPVLNILDLAGVPYMDSKGVGMIVSHHVSCRSKGVRMIATGLSARVLEVFKLTKVDTILPIAATVEDVDLH